MSAPANFVKPANPPKYFALDVDGTFFAEDAEAYKKNRKAFRKMVEAGYVPFCCTGRPLSAISDILFELKDDGIYNGFPGVYQNGATVYGHKGELISVSSFSSEFLLTFCDILVKNSLESIVVFLSSSSMYALTSDSPCWDHIVEIWDLKTDLKCVSADVIAKSHIVQIMVSDYKVIKEHMHYKEGVDYIVKHGAYGLSDINPPGITKIKGITQLLKTYNVELNDCGYIGDGENDTEAMEASNMSFAVGNATDMVKQHAKFVLEETNEEAAFAKAIYLVYGIKVD